MKMHDKNGNLTIVARVIFDNNMARLRNGENPLSIAQSMSEQVQLLKV